jgi:beta-lactamase regulating signal transducer with metallopeptidase domain
MTGVLSNFAGLVSGSVEFSMLAKATLVLIAGLVATAIARRARASIRHLLLAATFAALAALPLAMLALPPLTVDVPATSTPAFANAAARGASSATAAAPGPRRIASVSPATPSTWSWPALVRRIWAIGALVLAVSFASSVVRLIRIGRSGIPWLETRDLVRDLCAENGISREVPVLLHEAVAAPLTYGALHPRILLPADARTWSQGDLRRALVHEIEHVHRGDWLTQALARTVCAAYWFHPLAWSAWRQLSLEAERACDDAVLRSEERTDYADQLVELARRMKASSSPALVAMASRSDLGTRVTALLDATQRRGRVGRRATALVLPAAAAAVLTIAPLRAVTVVSEAGPSLAGAQTARPQQGSSRFNRGLVEAAGDGDVQAMTEFLNAGADIDAAVDGDGSPLIAAAREGHLLAVRFLLERGADVNLAVAGDGNPLIMAAREGHRAIVELLLSRGAIVDQVVPGDENALIQASGSGHLPIVEMLVSQGADVNAAVWVGPRDQVDGAGEWRTPLSMARRGRHANVEKFLLSRGASR